jgi:dTDP-4-dehydrorhamnose reductase
MRIAITGTTGYIGARLQHYLQRTHEITSITHKNDEEIPPFDLCQPSTIRQALQYIDVDVIIHTAAIARRQLCTANPRDAYVANVEATKVIAEWAKESGIRLIFLSSLGIHEDNIYANTKRLAEQAIKESGVISTTLRLAYTFGFSPSFSKPKPMQLLEAEAHCPGSITFDNSWHFQPTSLEHVCNVLRAIVANSKPPQEINVVTMESTTMFQIASACLPHQIRACQDLKDRMEHFIPNTHLLDLGLPQCNMSSFCAELREVLKHSFDNEASIVNGKGKTSISSDYCPTKKCT